MLIFIKDYEETMNFKMPENPTKKKINEDGSFYVPSSAESSIDGKRKPFTTLTECDTEQTNGDMDIDFEPPVASTCNFKQLRAKIKSQQNDMDFEPSSSSTCNYKNLRSQKETHERLLETILDETDADTSSADLKKEKLLTNFLSKCLYFLVTKKYFKFLSFFNDFYLLHKE